MLNFGTSEAHSNRFRFIDNNTIDAVSWYVIACFYEFQALANSPQFFFGKGNDQGSGNGYFLGNQTNENLLMRHRDPTATNSESTAVYFEVDSTVHSLIVAHDKNSAYFRIYKNGSFVQSNTFSGAIAGNTGNVNWGAVRDATGPAVKLGHMMLWTGQQADTPFTIAQVDAIAALFHTGQSIPQPNYLKYWIKGNNASTIINEITQEEATIDNTITLSANPVDAYFTGQDYLPMWREIASREIRRNRFPGLVHSAPLGPEVAGWELGDNINYSHWGIPRASSLTNNMENDSMTKTGQPVYCFLSGVRFDPANRRHEAMLEESEHYRATFWSTLKAPEQIDPNQDGLAQLDNGAQKSFNRSTPAWIQQSDNQIASVGAGYEKMNHEGFWSEESRTNSLSASRMVTATGGLAWTDNTGTGGTAQIGGFSVPHFLFKDSDNYPDEMVHITKQPGAFDSYITAPTVNVTASGSQYNRVQIWHKEIDGGSTEGHTSWRLQRNSDSGYWSDTGTTWSGSSVWNELPVRDLEVDHSKVIEATGSDTWTLDIGIASGTGGAVLVGQADIQNSRYALSPLVTSTGNTTTSFADSLVFTVDGDAARQIVYNQRHTVRATFVAKQNTSDMANGDVFPIFVAKYGNDNNNYLSGFYLKTAGGVGQFRYRVVLNGSVDAEAIYATDISAGTSYEVAFRKTDNSGNELGLPARTVSVFVDGAKGTDDQVSADFG